MGSESLDANKLHIVMFPWFAYGHSIPYLHLANLLAQYGHTITFLLPTKAKLFLEPSNLHPSLITFHPIIVPHVDPLPPGTQTCSDVPISLHTHLASAMDLTRPQVESILAALYPKPNVILFDMAHWVPEVATALGIKSVFYVIVCAVAFTGIMYSKDDKRAFTTPRWAVTGTPDFGEGITLEQRVEVALRSSDAIAFRTVHEMEEASCNLLAKIFNKPLLLTGPTFLKPVAQLEARWDEWLGQFGQRSVIFCCFGSQYVLDKAQFQEMAQGLEMTQLPFLMAVKPPDGCATLEEALPEGYMERVGGRGLVYGGWVPQTQILAHPSVGCFVTHCGFGSTWEGLMSECQLVMVPQLIDQVRTAEMMAEQLKVGVKVEREEDGRVSKESLFEAIKSVMDDDSEVGAVVKKNHATWKERLLQEGFMTSYVDNFNNSLLAL